MKKKELYIPVNVPDRNELIPGFGMIELLACGISLGIGIVVAILFLIAGKGVLWALGSAIATLAFAIMIFRKNQYGENIVFKAKYIRKYHKVQQKFFYQYHNIYEGSVRNERK